MLRADSWNGLRSSVTSVGDVDGDGVADVAVASRDRERPERVWILSGRDGAVRIVISGSAHHGRFGSEFVPAGDWNGDGVPDVVILAGPAASFDFASRTSGRRTVHSGRDGSVLHELDSLGAVAGGRDLDGDGCTELALWSDGELRLVSPRGERRITSTPPTVGNRCDALVWTGDVDRDGAPDLVGFALSTNAERDRAPLAAGRLTAGSSASGTTLWSADVHGRYPADSAILRTVDFDRDGERDVVLGLEDEAVRVFRGRDGAVLLTVADAWDAILTAWCSSMDVIDDRDGDGVDDLIVGAHETAGQFFDEGSVSVIALPRGTTRTVVAGDECFGFDVCALGDVNGDGVPDFAVGAERERAWTPDEGSEPAVQMRSGKDASIRWMKRHVDLRK